MCELKAEKQGTLVLHRQEETQQVTAKPNSIYFVHPV